MGELMQALQARHSVRSYSDAPIPKDIQERLEAEIEECNNREHLSIRLVTDEPDAFGGFRAHYGAFRNVRNYIALVGPKGPSLEERLGYCGERIAILAQSLGLNSCWVAMSFRKGRTARALVGSNEKLVCVIALGYGTTQGTPHRSKPLEKLYRSEGSAPGWFLDGVAAASLAPTAVNQQKFRFTLVDENHVRAESSTGPYSKVDLGIVMYHFELGAGKDAFQWER
ncbi:MAG: nitroreductase family protein [Sphaerochaetaceae bacterium]|jgi:nitroreductase